MVDNNFLYQNKELWYDITKKHWEKSEGTDTGMLGGNIELHNIDIIASKELIEGYINKKFMKTSRVLEIGAGIGRVTKDLLSKYFNEIYLVEQDESFVKTAKQKLNDISSVKNIICSPMQKCFDHENNKNLIPKDLKFDVIWIQWCIENIDDHDLVQMLKDCKSHLNERGMIIIKENVVEDNDSVTVNNIDYSRVRNDKLFKELFKQAGLKMFKHMRHPNWPEGFMDVSVFALM